MLRYSIESRGGLTVFQFTELVVEGEHHEMEEQKDDRNGTVEHPSCDLNLIVLVAGWVL